MPRHSARPVDQVMSEAAIEHAERDNTLALLKVCLLCLSVSVSRCVGVSAFRSVWVVGFYCHSNISVDQSKRPFDLKNFVMCLCVRHTVYVCVSVHSYRHINILLSHLCFSVSLSHPAQVRSLTTENDLIQQRKAKLEDELFRQVLHPIKHTHTPHTHLGSK